MADAVRTRLGSPEGVAYARKRIAQRLGELAQERNMEVAALRDRLARSEQRIAKMVDAIADGERSRALSDALRDTEAAAKADRESIVALVRAAREPVNLPTPEAVMRRVNQTIALFEQNPAAARERLRAMIGEEGIRLEISTEGHYIGRATVFPLILMAKANHAEPFGRESGLLRVGSGDAFRTWDHAIRLDLPIDFARAA